MESNQLIGARTQEIYFVNTFEPVVSLYRDVLPRLEQLGFRAIAIVSHGTYRRQEQNNQVGVKWQRIWVPSFLRHRRRWCSIFYWLLTPFVLLRPNDILISRANPAKAKEKLGWLARYKMNDVVRMMVEVQLQPKERV